MEARQWFSFIGGSQKGGFQKGGFGGCSPGTKTGTRVRSPKPPFWKPPFYLPITLFGVDKRVVSKRVVSADVLPERKPERGYVRQNHPFTKPPFYLPVILFFGGEFAGNLAGFFRDFSDPQNKGSNILGKFSEHFLWEISYRNYLKYVRSNLAPSRLLPNSCLLNPSRGQNRTEFRGSFLVLSKGKATKFVRTRGFSKLTRFRNTGNLVNPLFWTWTWLKHFRS